MDLMTRPEIVHAPVERFFQFSLLGLLLSGYLAVAGSGYLDAIALGLGGAGLLFRTAAICGLTRFQLSERSATFIALGYALFFGLDYLFLSRDFLSATVHLVFFLALMKILTARNDRDYLALAAIAFLELVWAAILSINFNFLMFLTFFLLFGIAALTSGEIRRSMRKTQSAARCGVRMFHPRLAALTIWISLGIMALTGGMFFLLPRTAEAALSGLISHRMHIPGLSSQVTLGEIGELKTSSRPVMHIAIYSTHTPGAIKWRGNLLTEFDGRVWKEPEGKSTRLFEENGKYQLLRSQDRPPGRAGLYYGVRLEELDTPALFVAGMAESVEFPERADLEQKFQMTLADPYLSQTETGCLRLEHKPPPGFRYEVVSRLDERPETAIRPAIAPVLTLREREQSLQLPHLDARIAPLAREMAAGAAGDSDLARARAVETRLRTGYGYTLQLPEHAVDDPLAYFLFTRKKGHCEYFASAMAVMLRTLGIPTRLATGFQSGVYNPVSDLWLVRASDAHSWVEAWIPGLGWTTFDPTPADPNAQGSSLLSQFNLYLDAAETFWQSWVVGYDPGRQGTLADRLLAVRWFDSLSTLAAGWESRGKSWLRQAGPWAAVAVLAIFGFVWMGPRLLRLLRIRRQFGRVRRGEASVADATMLYQRMLQMLKRRGYQKPAWFTPAEFARSLEGTEVGQPVEDFTRAYNAVRFGGCLDEAPRMSALLDVVAEAGQSARH
jgi:transglutaminase-like putative cysteine protease